MRIGIIVFLIIGLNFCTAQTAVEKEIVGSWKLVTQITAVEENDDSTFSENLGSKQPDALIQSDVLLRFKKDKSLVIDMEKFVMEVRYSIKKNILTIGVRQFEVISIQNDILTLKETTTENGLRYKYKKIKTDA
ncbi:DUF5004 domain-containing protein [Kordia jejudonensis]|uniref:DUF5004 domain-containing protein n=1 Tax=Kordia jejudonensis TaxID=1348245 RepID=UPI0006298A13|nr:DUF5004 domain-containing protein [Kordia jejudonensis]